MANGYGFYVPGSKTGSYVASKRNEEGSYGYEAQVGDVNRQEQAALQNLQKSYDQSINNAYASYLANQRAIGNSALGQGFKEQYLQNQQQQFAQNVAQANMNAANARQQITQSAGEAKADIQNMYQNEVANMDRIADTLGQYKEYLYGLSKTETIDNKPVTTKYMSDEMYGMDTSDLYNWLLEASPTGYTTEKADIAKSYYDWLDSIATTDADRAWVNWAKYQGGINDFKKATAKSGTLSASDAAKKGENIGYSNQIKQTLKDLGLPENLEFGEFESNKDALDYLTKNQKAITEKYGQVKASENITSGNLPSDLNVVDNVADKIKSFAGQTLTGTITSNNGTKYEVGQVIKDNIFVGNSADKNEDYTYLKDMVDKYGKDNIPNGTIIKLPSKNLVIYSDGHFYKVYKYTNGRSTAPTPGNAILGSMPNKPNKMI